MIILPGVNFKNKVCPESLSMDCEYFSILFFLQSTIPLKPFYLIQQPCQISLLPELLGKFDLVPVQ